MAGKLGYYSHESLNFPIVGSDSSTLSLPECDLFSSIPNQNSIESSSYDILHPEDGNLLISSPELRFVSKASLKFSDLADRYRSFLSNTHGQTDRGEGGKVFFKKFSKNFQKFSKKNNSQKLDLHGDEFPSNRILSARFGFLWLIIGLDTPRDQAS